MNLVINSYDEFLNCQDEDNLKIECCNCGVSFSPSVVYSQAGWRETQISGLCEVCFEDITQSVDEDSWDDDDDL